MSVDLNEAFPGDILVLRNGMQVRFSGGHSPVFSGSFSFKAEDPGIGYTPPWLYTREGRYSIAPHGRDVMRIIAQQDPLGAEKALRICRNCTYFEPEGFCSRIPPASDDDTWAVVAETDYCSEFSFAED